MDKTTEEFVNLVDISAESLFGLIRLVDIKWYKSILMGVLQMCPWILGMLKWQCNLGKLVRPAGFRGTLCLVTTNELSKTRDMLVSTTRDIRRWDRDLQWLDIPWWRVSYIQLQFACLPLQASRPPNPSKFWGSRQAQRFDRITSDFYYCWPLLTTVPKNSICFDFLAFKNNPLPSLPSGNLTVCYWKWSLK